MSSNKLWIAFENYKYSGEKGFWTKKIIQNSDFDILSILALAVKMTSYINENIQTNIKLEYKDQETIIQSNSDEVNESNNLWEYVNVLLSKYPLVYKNSTKSINKDKYLDIIITDKSVYTGVVNLVHERNSWYLKVKKENINEKNYNNILKIVEFVLDRHINLNFHEIQRKSIQKSNLEIKNFSERFYESMRNNKNKIAICDEESGIELSYEELWNKSNQLINNIYVKTKSKNLKVALFIEKSWKYILAVLTIQRLGGTCILIDVKQPINRLLNFLDDVEPDLVLTSKETSAFIKNKKFKTLEVEEYIDSSLIFPRLDIQNLENKASFIAGTSGTTGKPKASCLSYKGMSVTLDAIIKTAHLNEDSVGTWFSSPGYGMIEVDCLPILSVGGTIKIYPRKLSQDIASIVIWMNEQNISHTLVMTSIAEAIWETPIELKLSTMLIAGEKCKTWPPRDTRYSVFNVYGSAEAAVVSIENLSKKDGQYLPTVGNTINGANAYIVDKEGVPLPKGCIGELVVTGETLSLGYMNPKDTRRSFSINNFDNSSRLKYHTGDRARINLDGKIEIFGRIDSLIKVRGHRVDLSEIEIKVMEMKKIKKVAATLIDENIVLFIESDVYGLEQTNHIREYINKYLPAHFEPTRIEFINIPLTNNGKVDYKKLKEYKFNNENKKIQIHSNIELYLKEKWEKWTKSYLKSNNCNFFYEGGDSLSAMRLVGELFYEKNISIKMNEFLSNPTFSSLLDLVRNAQNNELPYFKVTDQEDKYKPFELNESQQALWIGRGIDFDYGGVGCQGYFEWEIENLDFKKLSNALNNLINRHDMLRMVINKEGKQKIIEKLTRPYIIKFNDLSKESPDVVANKISKIRNKMSNEEIGFSNWPLFKVEVSKISNNKFRLHFCIDMLIADAWSIFQVLIPDLIDIYLGNTDNLPKIKTSFKDYVQYKNSLKETNQYIKEKQFWIDKIPTLPPAPKLPMVDKESKDGIYQFRRFEGKLNRSKWESLKKSGRERDISPSGVVAVVLCEVLRLWNESNDFTLNFPVSDRLPVSDDIDNIVGDFTNTLLVPYQVDKDLNLEEKGSILQKEIWDALDNRLFTGVEVLRELSRRNRNGKEPLMPIVLTSLLGHPKRHDASLLGKEVYGVSQTPQVTLDVQIRESDGNLIFKWDYLTNAIKPTVVKDMFEMFSKVLNEISEDVSVWEKKTLNLLPDYQKKQRELINSTEVTVPDIDLKKLLLNKLTERPNEICLIYKNYNYSWKELINESKKLSKLINKFRALEKEFVGILLPKSVYQYQAVYGCLLSNVGYIPIDINLPKKRINTIIKKANIKTIITDKEMTLHFPNLNKIEIDDLEDSDVSNNIDTHVKPKPSEYSPYVIFTSGSTGEPKGVEILEKSVLNHIQDVVKRFNLDSKTCHLATASLNFDMSVFDIFGPLLHGGKVIIPEQKEGPDPETWINLQKKYGVNFWACVPAIMELVCYLAKKESGLEKIKSMKNIVMAGDWIPLNLLPKIREIFPNAKLYSCGGPTETTNWSIVHTITKTEGEICSSVIYGTPMANSKYHIMNKNLEHCPNWVAGEMIVESEISLARGYLNEKKLTDNAFFKDSVSGKRMYKTGDLGRYLPNGEIEILGRLDNQIKIKGLRIELSEIEKLTLELEDVQKVIAVVLKDRNGKNKNIAIAYTGEECNEKILQKLKKHLPDYMIPSVIKRFSTFPLSNNEKVDVKNIRSCLSNSNEKKSDINQYKNILREVIKILSENFNVTVILPQDKYSDFDENLKSYHRIKNEIEKRFNLKVNGLVFNTNDTVEIISKKIKELNSK